MSADLIDVLFVAAGLVAVGAFVTAWKHDLTHALAGLPLMFAGAGTAFAGASRFAAGAGYQLVGQEMAVLLSLAALAAVALGVGLAGREGSR